MQNFLFSFEGRTRRRDWWLFVLAGVVLNYVVMQLVLPTALGDRGRMIVNEDTLVPQYPLPLAIAVAVYALIVAWPYLAVNARRAHDRGVSARFVTVMQLASMGLGWALLAMSLEGSGTGLGLALAVSLPSVAVGLYFLVVQGFVDGTPGPNPFGPSPKGVGDAAREFE